MCSSRSFCNGMLFAALILGKLSVLASLSVYLKFIFQMEKAENLKQGLSKWGGDPGPGRRDVSTKQSI